jgi:hypothetical protein
MGDEELSVPETYAGTHTGCGGTIAFSPRVQEAALAAGQTVTLQTACTTCGQIIAIHCRLGVNGAMELVAAPPAQPQPSAVPTAPEPQAAAPAVPPAAQLGTPRLVDETAESAQLFPPAAAPVPEAVPAVALLQRLLQTDEHALRQAAQALELVAAGSASAPPQTAQESSYLAPPTAQAGSSAYQEELEQRVAAARHLVDTAQAGLPTTLSTDAFKLPSLSEPTSAAIRALEERPYYEPEVVAEPEPQPAQPTVVPEQTVVAQPQTPDNMEAFWAQTPTTLQEMPQPEVQAAYAQPEQHVAPQYAPVELHPHAAPAAAQPQTPVQPDQAAHAPLQFGQPQSAAMAGAVSHQPALVSPPAHIEDATSEPRGFDWGEDDHREGQASGRSLMGIAKVLLVLVLFAGIGYLAFDTVQRLRSDGPPKQSSGSKTSSTKSSTKARYELQTEDEAPVDTPATTSTTPTADPEAAAENGDEIEDATATEDPQVDVQPSTASEGDRVPDGDLASAGAQDSEQAADTSSEVSNPFN